MKKTQDDSYRAIAKEKLCHVECFGLRLLPQTPALIHSVGNSYQVKACNSYLKQKLRWPMKRTLDDSYRVIQLMGKILRCLGYPTCWFYTSIKTFWGIPRVQDCFQRQEQKKSHVWCFVFVSDGHLQQKFL